jgi:hypothetical protein
VKERQTQWRNAYIATKRMVVQHLGAKVLVINLGAKAPTTSYNFRARKMGMRPLKHDPIFMPVEVL